MMAQNGQVELLATVWQLEGLLYLKGKYDFLIWVFVPQEFLNHGNIKNVTHFESMQTDISGLET
jgi:hypothetical protein